MTAFLADRLGGAIALFAAVMLLASVGAEAAHRGVLPLPAAIADDVAAPSPVAPATTLSAVAPPTPQVLVPGTRIRVPRLGIDLPLTDGDLARDVIAGATPDGVALLYPGTPAPGAGGNSYVYAHARAGAFLPLWQATPGDVVIISAAERELRYTIERVVPRVAVNDTSWLAQDGAERLTLQTSTGPHAADPRFVVVARAGR